MRRRKHKRMGPMSIMCITAIVGLSAMGVGYGYWTDSLNIGVSVSTGFLKPEFDREKSELVEGLSLSLLNENTLDISGNVFEGTNGTIKIRINNNSSIPIMIDKEVIEVIGTTDYNIPLDIPVKTIRLKDEHVSLIREFLEDHDEELDMDKLIEKLDIGNQYQSEYRIDDTLIFKQGL